MIYSYLQFSIHTLLTNHDLHNDFCIYKLCLERVENSHQSEIEVLKKEVRNIDKELFRIADVITIASSSTLIENFLHVPNTIYKYNVVVYD